MGLSVARFAPGDEVETHSHETMDEVFYGQEGKGIIEVEGNVVEVRNEFLSTLLLYLQRVP